MDKLLFATGLILFVTSVGGFVYEMFPRFLEWLVEDPLTTKPA